MGKKKLKFKTKINPEKSNKMIIAVAIGLLIVLIVFLLVTILGSSSGISPQDKEAFITKELEYLKTTDGIADLKIYPQENKVVIIYEGYKNDRQNFPKIARFAGLKLSNKMTSETLTIILAKDNENQVIRTINIKNRRVITEKIPKPE